MTNKVMLVGASGFIGRRVLDRLAGRALATFRDTPIAGGVHFDSTTMKLRDAVQPKGVTHAVLFLGESNTIACGREPARTDRINIDSIVDVLKDLREMGIKPVFMSSDAVFDGKKGDYSESDAPNPLMRYGYQKLAVERYLSDNFPYHLVLRASKTYDGCLERNFMARWLADITAKRTIALATDHIFCPIHVDDLACAIVAAVDSEMKGIHHAGGPEKVTYWQLFQMLLDGLGLSQDQVDTRRALINDFAVNEPRPIDSSLVSDDFFSRLGINRRHPSAVCAEFIHVIRSK
jgi:dTDP-4-dehydrorhamnose reductase